MIIPNPNSPGWNVCALALHESGYRHVAFNQYAKLLDKPRGKMKWAHIIQESDGFCAIQYSKESRHD